MLNTKQFKLRDKVTREDYFRMLNEASRRMWSYSIKTELDDLSFREADHDDIDLRDKFGEVEASNDLYKIVGFIVIENIQIESIEVSNGQNTITVREGVIHFDGTEKGLVKIFEDLGMNSYYWFITNRSKIDTVSVEKACKTKNV